MRLSTIDLSCLDDNLQGKNLIISYSCSPSAVFDEYIAIAHEDLLGTEPDSRSCITKACCTE